MDVYIPTNRLYTHTQTSQVATATFLPSICSVHPMRATWYPRDCSHKGLWCPPSMWLRQITCSDLDNDVIQRQTVIITILQCLPWDEQLEMTTAETGIFCVPMLCLYCSKIIWGIIMEKNLGTPTMCMCLCYGHSHLTSNEIDDCIIQGPKLDLFSFPIRWRRLHWSTNNKHECPDESTADLTHTSALSQLGVLDLNLAAAETIGADISVLNAIKSVSCHPVSTEANFILLALISAKLTYLSMLSIFKWTMTKAYQQSKIRLRR